MGSERGHARQRDRLRSMREKREKVSGSIKEINEVFSCVFLILSTGGVLSYGGVGAKGFGFFFFSPSKSNQIAAMGEMDAGVVLFLLRGVIACV